MSFTLHTAPADARAFKALIAAQYSGVEVTIGNGTANPFGGPYLEVADGFVYDGTSAGRYIAGLRRDSSLFPGSYLEASEVESLVAWALTNVEAPGAALVGAAVNGESADVEGATATLKAGLAALDAYLLTRTYLVGESITFADISVAAGLVYPFQFIVDGAWRKSIGNVTRWFNTCVNQSEFSAVVGEVNLAKENLSAGKAAKKEAAPAAKKEEKPKKEEKKAEKPKADDDDDEPKPEKKAAHPLTLLPPSKMVLDEWKRTYSNFKSQPFTGVMAKFEEQFDASGYTLFKAVYQYPEECIVPFMVSNLLNGMLQRCDDVRKFMFGAFQIRKAEGDAHHIIDGAILLRGGPADIKHLLESNDDAQTYTWTPLEYPKDKQYVMDRWCGDCDDVVDGKVVVDAKVFK